MSDLISRSELIKHFEAIQQQENVVGLEFIAMIDEIKEQPTAYDVDKVVEYLELHSFEFGTDTLPAHYVRLNDAIEIVKQGGDDNDVCEWEKGSSGYVGYPAYYSKCCTTNSNGLEMQTHIIADWKQCPYCGKKIKVVEQMDEEEYRYCHKDEHIDEYHDCLDYMECEECPYYYADLD